MEDKMLQEMSVELLELEECWRELLRNRPKERSLPDVPAAEKRVAQVRKKRRAGIAFMVAAVLFYLLVHPRLTAFKEAMAAEPEFSLSPTLFTLLFWCVMAVLAYCAIMNCLVRASSKDLKAAEIYGENKRFNEQAADRFAADKEKIEKEHKEMVERINREAGTRLGDAGPRYFFQIPFDPEKTFGDYKEGMEFYSDALMKTNLADPPGFTCLGTAPVIHKPKERRYLHFDGFYSLKNCKVSEALAILEKGGYTVLFQDKAYLQEHPEDKVWLQCIWDTKSVPVADQGYFKFEEIELADCIHSISRKWTEMAQFMGSGIPEYESHVHVEKSVVKDVRWEYFHKLIHPSFYGDVADIKEGAGPFRLVNAKRMHILEKGYLMFHDKDDRMLYAALTDQPVYMSRINFNCSIYEWKKQPGFHGWIAGAGLSAEAVMPDKASTIQYLCNELYGYMPDFDAAAERPQGLTDGQYRLWMTEWYRAFVRRKNRQQKKAR